MPHPAILITVLLLAAGAAVYLELRKSRRPAQRTDPIELSHELVDWARAVVGRFQNVSAEADGMILESSLLSDSKDEIRQALKTMICYHILHRAPEEAARCRQAYPLVAAFQPQGTQNTGSDEMVQAERENLTREIEDYHRKILALFPAHAQDVA